MILIGVILYFILDKYSKHSRLINRFRQVALICTIIAFVVSAIDFFFIKPRESKIIGHDTSTLINSPQLNYVLKTNYSSLFFVEGKNELKELIAKLEIQNISDQRIRDLNIIILLYNPLNMEETNFFQAYNTNMNDYIRFGYTEIPFLDPKDSYTYHIDQEIKLSKKLSLEKEIVLPDFEKKYVVYSDYKQDRNKDSTSGYDFKFGKNNENNGTSLKEYYRNFLGFGKYQFNNSNGLRLKLIIEYRVGRLLMKNLLIGGLFYLTYNEGNYSIPKPFLVESFYKTRFTFCREISKASFFYFELPQEVVTQKIDHEDLNLIEFKQMAITKNNEMFNYIFTVTLPPYFKRGGSSFKVVWPVY